MTEILVVRPNAHVEPVPGSVFNRLVCDSARSFLADRPVNPRAQGDLRVHPGVIYEAFSGIKLPGVTELDLVVRPTLDAFREYGLRVERVETSDELVIYFSALKEFDLHRVPVFEFAIRKAPVHHAVDPTADELAAKGFTVTRGQDAPAPGVIQVEETKHVTEIPQSAPVADDGDAQKSAEQKAKEWLNSEDEKGGGAAPDPAAESVSPELVAEDPILGKVPENAPQRAPAPPPPPAPKSDGLKDVDQVDLG